MTEVRKLAIGPRDGILYPIDVLYCGNCSMPIEVRTFLTPTLQIVVVLIFSTANIIQSTRNVKLG